MSRDLSELLDRAVPPEVGGPDLDAIESRVVRRRWTTGTAAVLAILGVVVGVSLLVGGQPSMQIVGEPDDEQTVEEVDDEPGLEQDDRVESMLRESGAFDRGSDETLYLDPDTDQRLHGQVLVELDALEPARREIAVGADGAIGVRDDAGMRILLDGTQIAARDLAPPSEDAEWSGQFAVAFDTDGTLWGFEDRSVVGLRRDGTTVDIDEAFPPPSIAGLGPGMNVGLRVTGTNVSVVLHDLDDPGFAAVLPVVGEDSLSGTRTVDSPTPPGGEAHALRIDGELAIITTASVVGGARAFLDWQVPPSDEAGYSGGLSESQIVADTSASLAHMSIYDGSFLIVHRADGLAAAALVDGGPHAGISVSPDGAVHLIVTDDGSVTVRTLLDMDLRPLQGPPITEPVDQTDLTADGAELSRRCLERNELYEEAIVDVDLDGDGADDRVTLHQDGVIQACLGDGTTSAVASSVLRSEPHALELADLGGIDGVAVVIQFDSGYADTFLLRMMDGELGVIGETNNGEKTWRGLTDITSGVPAWSGEYGPREHGAFGCRPSTSPDVDFELAQLVWSGPDAAVDTTVDVQLWKVTGLNIRESPQDAPQPADAGPDTDLDRVLRDFGFTPQCLTED